MSIATPFIAHLSNLNICPSVCLNMFFSLCFSFQLTSQVVPAKIETSGPLEILKRNNSFLLLSLPVFLFFFQDIILLTEHVFSKSVNLGYYGEEFLILIALFKLLYNSTVYLTLASVSRCALEHATSTHTKTPTSGCRTYHFDC